MPDDVVEDVGALVKAPVWSMPKQIEEEVECMKRGLNVLRDDTNKRLGTLKEHTLNPVLDLDRIKYTSTLKEWIGKATATIIFDSNVDDFTDECFFQAVKGKHNIAIIAATTDGDVFGGFYSVAVTEQDKYRYDPAIFAFSFESHGRCETPQQCVAKEERKENAYTFFFNKYENSNGFVSFGVGYAAWFRLGNEKLCTWCWDLSKGFEGLEDTTLTGRDRGSFSCCRIVATQLE